MAETLSARAASVAVAAVVGPSHSKQISLTANVGSHPDVAPIFAVGQAVTAPAVFTDLAHAQTFSLDNAQQASLRQDNLGNFSVSASFVFSAFASMVVGDEVWLCVFDVPATGAAPVLASASLGSLLA